MNKYLSTYAPSLGELWLIFLALVCAGGSLIGGGIALMMQILFHLDQASLNQVALGAYPLTFALAIPFIYFRAKESYMLHIHAPKEMAQSLPPQFGKLPIALFLLLLLLLVPIFSTTIEPLYIWIPMPEFIKKLFESISQNGWVSWISIVVMAPLFEEWLCRKVALGGLLNRGYSPAVAILWSALMFGVMHMNPWQAIPAFFLGLLFGWVYWRTRSIWAPIFMHAVNNGLSVLFSIIFPELPEDYSTLDIVGPSLYPWVLILTALVSVAIIWLLHKKLAPVASLFQKPTPQPVAT